MKNLPKIPTQQKKRVSFSPQALKYLANQINEEAKSPHYAPEEFGEQLINKIDNLPAIGEEGEEIIDAVEDPNKVGKIKLIRTKATKGGIKLGNNIIRALTSETTQNIVLGATRGIIETVPGGSIITNVSAAALNNIRKATENKTEEYEESAEIPQDDLVLENLAEISSNILVMNNFLGESMVELTAQISEVNNQQCQLAKQLKLTNLILNPVIYFFLAGACWLMNKARKLLIKKFPKEKPKENEEVK